jgi:very-short-patch-repair endonuclease
VLDRAFRGSTAVAAGLLTRGQLRGTRFRRVFPDVYLPISVDLDLAARSRAAYLLVTGRGALAGWSAAELLGAGCAPLNCPAEVIITAGELRSHAGLLVHRGRLGSGETRCVDDVVCTSALRTAYDLARWRDLSDAVVALDSLAALGGFAPRRLIDMRRRRPGSRNCRRIDHVVDPADPRSESAMESRLRLLLVLNGLPRPVVQHPVTDERRRVVAYLDLAYPRQRVGIEYDGSHHLTPVQVAKDIRRGTRLLDLGWRVYRFTAADVLRTPDRTVSLVSAALASAKPT